MAYTHVIRQWVATPEEQLGDTDGTTKTADTITSVTTTVDSYAGGTPNAVAIAFTAAGLQSIALLSTVPCVVTLTGATVIDNVTTSTITLAANVVRTVSSITGNVTAVSVGANTTEGGAAGTIKISALFNS